MTLLPIAERELRVASRRWYTFWGRLGAAAFALLVFFGLHALAAVTHGSFRAGEVQFAILKWMCFLFACSAGVFLTSDSLSEEKREGTLGLLFLTDLRGYDVVLGKLICHSLQTFYGLVAAVPILGLTMLSGGVAGAEFGHVMLIIGNTLFLSLCTGLFVSSISRDVMKAMNGALFLFLFFLLGLPFVDWCLAGCKASNFSPFFSLGSPVYLFSETGPYLFRQYWLCLGIQHLLAWVFLILACVAAPRAWQEKSTRADSSGASFSRRWRFGGKRARLRLRQKLLGRDPLLWLAVRDRWQLRFTWCVMAIGLAVLSWSLFYYRDWGLLVAASYLQILFGFALMLWMASQASRFFVEGIRTGALELILVTPVVPAQIIRSQWKALFRAFFVPALLLIVVNTAGTWYVIHDMQKNMAKMKSPSSAGFDFAGMQIATLCVGVVKLAGNLAAVAWFGMWMGMTTRKTSLAVFKTICFVIVIPAIVLAFGQGMIMATLMVGKLMSFRWPFWISIAIGGVLSLAKNVFFIVLARQRLYNGFRDAMHRQTRIPQITAPPQAPPPISQPPPIVPVAMRAG